MLNHKFKLHLFTDNVFGCQTRMFKTIKKDNNFINNKLLEHKKLSVLLNQAYFVARCVLSNFNGLNIIIIP